ncbi:hypothetical protein BDR04DRAFT_1148887 [Suillus decipiens]|nr:hypothetical protein BDR04DRAFT_1148887 [Suillus decipiens]
MSGVVIQAQQYQPSAATTFLTTPSRDASEESDLLRSIRAAIRSSGTNTVNTTFSPLFTDGSESWIDQELSWNDYCVVLSEGGVIKRKWDLSQENQIIQHACIGKLMQPTGSSTRQAHGSAHYTKSDETPGTTNIFGPFASFRNEAKAVEDSDEEILGVFVFLRSIGKVFLRNGMDYTFSLPFLVHRAWPLRPHGVLIQRILDPAEVDEARVTGDDLLPTIFTITSAFSEPEAVGITSGILGGFGDEPVVLVDEEEHCSKPLVTVPASDEVVWVSPGVPNSTGEFLVTFDADRGGLSIWRYAYLKPKDAPVPLTRTRRHSASRKSVTAPGNRRQSSVSELLELDRRLPQDMEFDDDFPPPFPPKSGLAPSTTSGITAQPPIGRKRDSISRLDLSLTMDRMALGGQRDPEVLITPVEHGRMKASYWAQQLTTHNLGGRQLPTRDISVALFDQRFDGKVHHSLLAVCLPEVQVIVFMITIEEDKKSFVVESLGTLEAVAIASIRATRGDIWDLLAVKKDGSLSVFTHGLQELRIQLRLAQAWNGDNSDSFEVISLDHVVALKHVCVSSVYMEMSDGKVYYARLDMTPRDPLVTQAIQVLALVLPKAQAFDLHRSFLESWSRRYFRTSPGLEFQELTLALFALLDLTLVYPFKKDESTSSSVWERFSAMSTSSRSFNDDPALKRLKLPKPPITQHYVLFTTTVNPLLAPVLYGLHMLAEGLRLVVLRYDSLMLLIPVICQIAHIVRPEWADYWKRLCPDIMTGWPAPSTTRVETLDDRLPVWPLDMLAILYGSISHVDWQFPPYGTSRLAHSFSVDPSFAFGDTEPVVSLERLTTVYVCLADKSVTSTQKRAELTVEKLVEMLGTAEKGSAFLDSLPLGIAAPLREAIRTCQLSPPSHWRKEHYELIGRRDLAFSVAGTQPELSQKGIAQSAETYMNTHRRVTIGSLAEQAKSASVGEIDAVSGVELDLKGFTKIRFGQDRRLEEVARMLCSSAVPSVRLVERPELNEHDQAKEQQHQVVRIAERTLALPYGRAMFTFGSVLTVTKEAYVTPKMEYAVRIQPSNITSAPELGKIPVECLNWGEFHNGVAAGLRISPEARGVESSWIAFNKPSELTPEHAGFLFGLGLTGHLKEMLTWHTFGYLTPKHDLTSIGVLLGLSAANAGTGNRHVTKLLAVHTPALLPTQSVDLNVSLMTQAAGLAGVGILYLGSKNRRMAEVCLHQISRKDLVQPDLSNEHREAYTYCAALAFGMIMLGQGSSVPADLSSLNRLRILVHGEGKSVVNTQARPTFDVNITSPAASIALGLMYLKTERRDVADILGIPSTVLELNRIQPSFLLMRTIARSLIMWNDIASTPQWLLAQVPESIVKAMHGHVRGKLADDAIELAYYNIIAGCCFVIGLKYAGTARHEAYIMLSNYFDMFSRFVAASGPAFDHKIKRSAVREGLNLISIALCMVMAGTGEITCLRRLRYAYGMYHQAFRYGVHVATHLSLGLLFLGAGRYTLGTSNAAIACMVVAFFPRFHHVSSDNKSYLQALRHLWVLAVEPRCLMARDVNTKEAVYLPVKITTKEGTEKGATQLISPTLIPDFNKILSIRIDTPRYWPFFVDLEHVPQHRRSLLKHQTLYVKRRTAFLSYTEDPRGSRSLFVRSGSSAGDAATLDFPQLTDMKAHPASDLTHFISSFSNDILFLAFADHFSREDGKTVEERVFHNYCHAVLLDSILQDKMETLQSHLMLYQYRTQSPSNSYFHLRMQDLRFAVDFYSKVYDLRFSGKSENNARPSLIRENTVSGALQALDKRLAEVQNSTALNMAFSRYACGEPIVESEDTREVSRWLAWYLLRHGVPSASLLAIFKQLAQDAHVQCAASGNVDLRTLDEGIKEVLRGTGTKMNTTVFGSGWSGPSLERVIDAWQRHVS